MHFEMRQRGRASVDFLADLGLWYVGLAPGVDAEMTARGLTEATLAPDLDERLAQVDATLADSPTFWAWSGLNDWLAERHGKAAAEAFEEIHADLAPAFDRLARGPRDPRAQSVAAAARLLRRRRFSPHHRRLGRPPAPGLHPWRDHPQALRCQELSRRHLRPASRCAEGVTPG